MLEKTNQIIKSFGSLLYLYWPIVGLFTFWTYIWYAKTGGTLPLQFAGLFVVVGVIVHGTIIAFRLVIGFLILAFILCLLAFVSTPFTG